ncbi:MAG: serine/threonine-protein kinase [Bacteroidales bacterium]|nr:serine/threonine-protein kinase [Bacteroidales bacterium]
MQRLNQDYEILSLLGIGGFGEVYKCREILSGHIVAVKRLLTNDKAKQKNILKEIRLLSKLSHPSIVKYLHTFKNEEQLHLVMEYCEIGSLANKIGKTGIGIGKATGMISSLIEAMKWVHSEGITHHDIKPQNILINAGDELKIADFGVANTLGGTPGYQAPEMFFNPQISPDDKRADIYALGLTIVEILTGENPFIGMRLGEIMIAHKTRAYGTGNLPYWLQEFLHKAIHPRPEKGSRQWQKC